MITLLELLDRFHKVLILSAGKKPPEDNIFFRYLKVEIIDSISGAAEKGRFPSNTRAFDIDRQRTVKRAGKFDLFPEVAAGVTGDFFQVSVIVS